MAAFHVDGWSFVRLVYFCTVEMGVSHADCDLGSVDAGLVEIALIAGLVPGCAGAIAELEDMLVHNGVEWCERQYHRNAVAIIELQIRDGSVCSSSSALGFNAPLFVQMCLRMLAMDAEDLV
jgi:hypothetical protein